MNRFPYELDTSTRKFTCPSCGHRKRFRLYIDTATSEYLPDNFGKCDREESCQYWEKPQSRSVIPYSIPSAYLGGHVRPSKPVPLEPGSFAAGFIRETISGFDQNNFVTFLSKLFPGEVSRVEKAIIDFRIGTIFITGKDPYTCFPYVDQVKQCGKAKLVRFDPETGRKQNFHSLKKLLLSAGVLKEDFLHNKDVFFGEHQLTRRPLDRVHVVEAEKTAVIASMFYPEVIWVATGSLSHLSVSRLSRLAGRRIVLFPDQGGYVKWQKIAAEALQSGLNVTISDLMKRESRKPGDDIADLLIERQLDRLEEAEERIAIMTQDGELSEDVAQNYTNYTL